MNKIYIVIPCAGSGSRAGGDKAKQYQEVRGLPMIMHTLAAVMDVPSVEHCLMVVAPHDEEMKGLLDNPPLHFKRSERVSVEYIGGQTRAQSVLAGLRALRQRGAGPEDWVLVHDAARCLVKAQWIEQLIDACGADDVGGILAWPLSDTLKQSQQELQNETQGHMQKGSTTPSIDRTLDRAHKWLAQTPQMFKLGPLTQAIESSSDLMTDESSAMEAQGLHPKLVAASALNIKVTYPEDFLLADAVLAAREPHSASTLHQMKTL